MNRKVTSIKRTVKRLTYVGTVSMDFDTSADLAGKEAINVSKHYLRNGTKHVKVIPRKHFRAWIFFLAAASFL
ncbi:MAG: hypothetical protein V4722_10825 [Bacteroidota bacterium]